VKAALLADVHANYPALCAALDRAEALGCERVLVAGDLVGGGPHPVETLRLLRSVGADCVRGNVDRKVLRVATDPEAAGKAVESPKKANWFWTWNVLGTEERRWLGALPGEVRLSLGGAPIRLFHGTPRSDEEYIFPSITPEAFADLRGDDAAGVWVFGHSHIPFTKVIRGIRLVNCGSAGRPVDGDPRGALAVLDLAAFPAVRVSIFRFDWDMARLTADIRDRNVPGALPGEFARGIKIKGA
jgi:predicted phosphodiesterase